MPSLNERFTRRGLIHAAVAVASGASVYSGVLVGKEDARQQEEALANIPPLSSTEEERDGARDLLEQGDEYLESLLNPTASEYELEVVDLQSPAFATAEAIIFEDNQRTAQLDEINGRITRSDWMVWGGAAGLFVSGIPLLDRVMKYKTTDFSSSESSNPSQVQ